MSICVNSLNIGDYSFFGYHTSLSIESDSESYHTLNLELQPADNARLINLCGPFDEHLQQIEQKLHVDIKSRGYHFNIIGSANNAQCTINILQDLYRATAHEMLTAETVHLQIQQAGATAESNTLSFPDSTFVPAVK